MRKLLVVKIKNGFTLIETISAIFIILIGLIGGLTLITRTISFMSLASSRLAASYLTQEGIEIVRNIRDTNWLEGSGTSWDEGLTECSTTGCVADYKHSYGPDQLDPILPTYSSQFLNVDVDGFYSYDSSGSSTKFTRKITIIPNDTDDEGYSPIVDVLVSVQWQQLGKSHTVSAREYLYDWYNQP